MTLFYNWQEFELLLMFEKIQVNKAEEMYVTHYQTLMHAEKRGYTNIAALTVVWPHPVRQISSYLKKPSNFTKNII